MEKKNILVFPCGSEVALEIYRSVQYSRHFNLIGANSIDDHGKFVFDNYIGSIPFYDDPTFIDTIKTIVEIHKIDAIYPAMDAVINILKKNEIKLGCKIVSAISETTEVCLSKSKTYEKLKNSIQVPIIYSNISSIEKYPVFMKPDVGYGSRGAAKIESEMEVEAHLAKYPTSIISEYLPGKEYTIDCFTNFNRELLFIGHRERSRISNGISVNTSTLLSDSRFLEIAKGIHEQIEFNGAWFFQVKEREDGSLCLMEIASRLGGSSAVYRMQGVNFALMSLFNIFKEKVSITRNNYKIELDRALSNSYKIELDFQFVYVDLDDTLLINNKINIQLITALFKFINQGKTIILITKHESNLEETLSRNKINSIFDRIIHLTKDSKKYEYIREEKSIFIDDSYVERKEVNDNLNIPTFSPDMVESLI